MFLRVKSIRVRCGHVSNVTLKGQESVAAEETEPRPRSGSGGLKMEELAAEASRAARGAGEAAATQSLLQLEATTTPWAGGVKGGGDVSRPGV